MTAQDFIFKFSPYKRISGDDYQELYKELSTDRLAVDGYNPLRKVDTTYHLCSATIDRDYGLYRNLGFEPVDDNVRIMSFRCGRYDDILSILVYINSDEGYIMKIGSYPSLSDFHKKDIKKYEKVLSRKQKIELLTAINIYNNGVGIGSYVYLRRIFESIVLEEAQNAISDGIIKEDEFRNMRMDDRIVALKDYLPAFLYEHHKELYGVLSKGIHELDEDDCLIYFPVMYDCITLILDERVAQKQREKIMREATSSLGKIASKVVK